MVIFVNGGVIESIQSNIEDVEIVIIDADDIVEVDSSDSDEFLDPETDWEKETKGLEVCNY